MGIYSNIRRSREYIEQKPPKFMLWFINLLVFVIIGLIIFSMIFKIEITVKGAGTLNIYNTEKIYSTHTGQISEILLVEGSFVREGDGIFTYNYSEPYVTESQEHVLISEYSGYIHYPNKIDKGTYIQKGQHLISIIPEDEVYIATMYVSTNDIAYLEVGTFVRIETNGLKSNKYGYVNGYIKTLDLASRIDSSTGIPYYTAIVSIEKNFLVDKHGNIGQLRDGMLIKSVVVVDRQTLFRWVINKLNLM